LIFELICQGRPFYGADEIHAVADLPGETAAQTNAQTNAVAIIAIGQSS
jgi:hypothetical protein